jgi:hypothetical protein
MNDMTADHLHRLLDLYPNGNIHSIVRDLLASLTDLEHEKEPERKAVILEAVRDLSALLDHELNEEGRAGEDYINDSVFHSMS